MQKKHEADILAEQIKKGKFNGKILKLRINKKTVDKILVLIYNIYIERRGGVEKCLSYLILFSA